MAKAKSEVSNPVFVFKIALADQEDIWRRIAVRASQTLGDLHAAIFDAFDREEEHLYSFFFPRPGSRGRARLRDAIEYSHPYASDEESPFGETRNAAKAKLRNLGLRPRQVFFYLFDFGDEWWHKITVEQINGKPERVKYPRVLERQGQSPPQYPDLEEE